MEVTRTDYSCKALEPDLYLPDVITITSETGVGGTTTEQALHALLPHYKFVTVSDIMEDIAKGLGMDKGQLAQYNYDHPEAGYDKLCDERVASFRLERNVGVGGRLPHVFIPGAFHVLLTCPVGIRAERRHPDLLKKGLKITFEKVLADIVERDKNDNARYAILYPGCLWQKEDYDFYRSTDRGPGEDVARLILERHRLWLDEKRKLGKLKYA